MKILISDPMDEEARVFLKSQVVDVDYNPEIKAADLLSSIASYNGLLVRSRTKVNTEGDFVLYAAKINEYILYLVMVI